MNKRLITQKGVTLLELMVVVVIVAMLAAIAYPSYTNHVKDTRRAEYRGKLMDLASSLENYRARNFSYKDADSKLASLSPGLASDQYYTVQITTDSDDQRYTIAATPKSGAAMAGDGTLKINSQGQTCYQKGGDCSLSATSAWQD